MTNSHIISKKETEKERKKSSSFWPCPANKSFFKLFSPRWQLLSNRRQSGKINTLKVELYAEKVFFFFCVTLKGDNFRSRKKELKSPHKYFPKSKTRAFSHTSFYRKLNKFFFVSLFFCENAGNRSRRRGKEETLICWYYLCFRANGFRQEFSPLPHFVFPPNNTQSHQLFRETKILRETDVLFFTPPAKKISQN